MDRAVFDTPAPHAETRGSKEDRLNRIADLLGCRVETFTDGASTGDVAVEAGELLRL